MMNERMIMIMMQGTMVQLCDGDDDTVISMGGSSGPEGHILHAGLQSNNVPNAIMHYFEVRMEQGRSIC